MDVFDRFLAQRNSKCSFQFDEVKNFFNTLSNNGDKLNFITELMLQIDELNDKKYPGKDARDFSTLSNEKIMNFLEKEEKKIERHQAPKKDEKNVEVILSRRETSILYFFLKKFRGTKNLNPSRLSTLIGELTGHSKQNLRTDMSEKNMEILLEQTDTENLENLLNRILSEIRANRNKKL